MDVNTESAGHARQAQPISLSTSTGPNLGRVTLDNFSVERIDILLPDQLDTLSEFPRSVAECIRQAPPTLPLSAFSRLYRPSSLYGFLDELSEFTKPIYGDIHFQLMIARCDITRPNGEVFRAQPVNTFSVFEYGDKVHCGPFFGSLANPLLKFAPWLSNEQRRDVVRVLVDETQQKVRANTLTVAFPPTRSGQDLSSSAAYQIMTSPDLQFEVFQGLREFNGMQTTGLPDHVYYFRGDPEARSDQKFITLLQTIRCLWSKRLVELQGRSDFLEEQRAHDLVRKQYVETVFGIIPPPGKCDA